MKALILLLSIGGGNARIKRSKKARKPSHCTVRRFCILLRLCRSKGQEGKHRQRQFRYHRLDVEPGIQDVRLDEWKPKQKWRDHTSED